MCNREVAGPLETSRDDEDATPRFRAAGERGGTPETWAGSSPGGRRFKSCPRYHEVAGQRPFPFEERASGVGTCSQMCSQARLRRSPTGGTRRDGWDDAGTHETPGRTGE